MANSAMPHDPRTVHVNLLVTKTLEVEEPDWCAGHGDATAQFKPDITHYGPEHLIEHGGFEMLRAMIAQSPYSEHASTEPALYVEDGSVTGSYTPAEVEQLATALEMAAVQLRALGHQLAEILDGGAA